MQRQFNRLLYHRFQKAELEAETPRPFRELLRRYSFSPDESRTDAISPEMLGTVFETFLHRRHQSGAYYTPKSIVTFMCREALKGYLEAWELPEAVGRFVEHGDAEGLSDWEQVNQQLAEIRIYDPACGSGAFLVGMLHELARLRRILRPQEQRGLLRNIIECNVFGTDVHPLALEIVRQRLGLAVQHETGEAPELAVALACGDSLLHEDSRLESFDIVITNPPYLSTKHGFGKENKAGLARRYRTATGQFDAYGLFIERGFELLRPGGHYAYIVPRPVLTNVNMRPVREVMEAHSLRTIALPGEAFGADVETVILVGAKAPPETGPIRVFDAVGGCHELSRTALITSRGTWNASAQAVAPCLEIPKSLPKLGDFVEIRRGVECGKRDGNIIQVPEPGTHPLLRGEDVTPLQIQFGGLYLRRGQDRLKFKPLKIYGGPKLLVRRVTNSLIAAVDESDAHVLNTLYILSPRDGVEVSLWYLCGLLNSHLLNRYFQHIWVNDDRLFPYVRKEQLQGLPIPVPDAEAVAMVEDLARRLAAGETELKAELDAVVEKIYRRLA